MTRAIIATALLILLYSCKGSDETRPIRKTIDELVFAAGTLDAADRYMLTAQSEGYITSLTIQENDTVNGGTIAAIIENTANAVNAAAAAQQSAIAASNLNDNAPAIIEKQEALKLAREKEVFERSNFERFSALYEKGSVSKSEKELAQLSYSAATAAREGIEQQIKLIKQQNRERYINQNAQALALGAADQYSRIQVISEGTVFKLFKKKGDFIRKGEVLASIAKPQSMVARLNVDESGFAKIKCGQPVKIKLNTLPDSVFTGILETIYPQFDEASQSYLVDVSINIPKRLQALGTRLEGNIFIAQKKDALLIPRNLLSYENTVRIKGDDKARKIKVGIKSTEWVEVLSGITENDILLPLTP
jgi:multidrug resistance efflux pump